MEQATLFTNMVVVYKGQEYLVDLFNEDTSQYRLVPRYPNTPHGGDHSRDLLVDGYALTVAIHRTVISLDGSVAEPAFRIG